MFFLLAGLYWLSLPLLTHVPVQLICFPFMLLLGLLLLWISQLKDDAYRDHLTGLYNRRYAERYVTRLLKNNDYPIGLIYCDINSLKEINDSQGHQVGDRQLQCVSGILRQCCRKGDIVARWGGDEFLILLLQTSLAKVREFDDHIRENFQTVAHDLSVDVAVGCEILYSRHCSFTEMLKNAEQAMYQDKARQKAKLARQEVG